MLSRFKKITVCLLTVSLTVSMAACGQKSSDVPTAAAEQIHVTAAPYELPEDAQYITLSGDTAALNGSVIAEYDYTWHCDPTVSHNEVKNAPAEYYTGSKPDADAAVYIDHAICYFPALDESGFQLVNYDGEMEWAYYYSDGEHDDFIFATLPRLGNTFPSQMMHTAEEAAQNKVLRITRPGTYILEGSWDGQIWVDLGDKDETFADPEAKITLILNNANITCTVAPGLVFYSAYECDNDWESKTQWGADVDTTDAGVTVILAPGSENTVTGCNIYRMLKTVYKDPDSTDPIKLQKKMRKIDAAFYSFVSMNIAGEGTLTVNSGFEGLNSELHLTILGGNITVNSQDDGINANEDHVSVVCFAGGNVTIHAAQGVEGDGVDSNGFIAIRGGNVSVNGIVSPDSALDSEDGILYESGIVTIDGQVQSYTPGSTFRESGNMGDRGGFGKPGDLPGGMFGSGDFDLQAFKEQVDALPDTATLEDVLALLGLNGMQDGFDHPQNGGIPMDQMPGKPGGN